MRHILVLVAWLAALPAGAVTMDWVYVGDPGNAPDTPTNCNEGLEVGGCGSVPYGYYISKYEVTNAQYAEFLNATAAFDSSGVYHPDMGADATFGGITQSGTQGSYSYAVKAGFENKPVVYVSFWDALRFANWLNNGQGSGDTETGAYTITVDAISNMTITRNPSAITFIPNEHEWYKAAYYDAIQGVYFDYPTANNAAPTCVLPASDTGNSANCWPATSLSGALTDVGAYAESESPSGTFDQGGNVWEWYEQILHQAGYRGGSWGAGVLELAASTSSAMAPHFEDNRFGFRVASAVPEPGTGLLLLTGIVGLAVGRKRRA
jgi:formylglycine-generating enzyme required for sulfatase activity